MSTTPPRPSHTTLAAGMVIGGSVLAVVTVAQQLSGLHSLETREAVAEVLSEPPADSLGLATSDALVVLRTALMVVGGCATAAAILGYHALRRSHRARLGLSVLAVPLFVGGLATGGFLTSLVAASTMLLWLGPSGAWFRGDPLPDPGRPRPSVPSGDAGADQSQDAPWRTQPPTLPPPQGQAEQPAPPTGPFPQPPPHPTPWGAWAPPTQAGATPGGTPARRPDAVLWACVLTWAFAGVALVGALGSAVVLGLDPDLVWQELQRQDPDLAARSGLDRDGLLQVTFVMVGVVAAWAAAAIVLAVLAVRRRPVGRVGLLACASVAAVVCLVAALSSVVMVLPAAGCAATVGLLARADVRDWYATAPPRP